MPINEPAPVDEEAPRAQNDSERTPSVSDAGLGDFFREVVIDPEEEEDYGYMEQPDPDMHKVELDFPGSRFIKWLQFVTRGQGIPYRAIVVIVVWTTFIVSMSFLASRKWSGNNDEDCDSLHWCSPLSMDSNVASYVGFALFLLLGFRVNDAYARYMEGVRNDDVAGVISAFCTFAGLAFKRGTFHKNDRERIFGLATAYAVTLKRSLRNEKDLRELKGMLSPRDLAAIQAADDMPAHCIYLLNAYLFESFHKDLPHLPPTFIPILLTHTQQMAAYQGQCMRIRNFKVVWAMAKELVDPFGYQFNDIRLGQITAAIQQDVRRIYRKSISGKLVTPLDTPNMLETATVAEGGNVPNEPPSSRSASQDSNKSRSSKAS